VGTSDINVIRELDNGEYLIGNAQGISLVDKAKNNSLSVQYTIKDYSDCQGIEKISE